MPRKLTQTELRKTLKMQGFAPEMIEQVIRMKYQKFRINEQDMNVINTLNAKRFVCVIFFDQAKARAYRNRLRSIVWEQGFDDNVDEIVICNQDKFLYIWFMRDAGFRRRMMPDLKLKCEENIITITPVGPRSTIVPHQRTRVSGSLTQAQLEWLKRAGQRARGELPDDPDDLYPE